MASRHGLSLAMELTNVAAGGQIAQATATEPSTEKSHAKEGPIRADGCTKQQRPDR